MSKYLVLIVLLWMGCVQKQPKAAPQRLNKPVQPTTQKVPQQAKPELAESFTDSLTIGRKGLNKVNLERYAIADSVYVVIRFYSKQHNQWVLKNEFHLPKDELIPCDPKLSDFNNDGLKDLTYVSAVAARGANDVRTLFIYNKKNDALVHIKNSENFPNMLYNKKLNCIDALLVSGCYVTVFLKLEADSLRQFASVDQCDSLTVSTYNKQGVQKVILRKPTSRDDISRFKNYHPLEEYTDL